MYDQKSISHVLLTHKIRSRDVGWRYINIYGVPEAMRTEESIWYIMKNEKRRGPGKETSKH